MGKTFTTRKFLNTDVLTQIDWQTEIVEKIGKLASDPSNRKILEASLKAISAWSLMREHLKTIEDTDATVVANKQRMAQFFLARWIYLQGAMDASWQKDDVDFKALKYAKGKSDFTKTLKHYTRRSYKSHVPYDLLNQIRIQLDKSYTRFHNKQKKKLTNEFRTNGN